MSVCHASCRALNVLRTAYTTHSFVAMIASQFYSIVNCRPQQKPTRKKNRFIIDSFILMTIKHATGDGYIALCCGWCDMCQWKYWKQRQTANCYSFFIELCLRLRWAMVLPRRKIASHFLLFRFMAIDVDVGQFRLLSVECEFLLMWTLSFDVRQINET